MQLTRTLPDNAVALRVGGQVSHSPARLAKLALRGVGSLRAPDLVATRAHPGKLALEAVFEARAQASMRELRDGLDGRLGDWGVHPGDTVSVYSYWFHTSARLGQLLADELLQLGADAAAAGVAAGRPSRAVELLEQTRGVLLAEIVESEVEHAAVAEHAPELAAELDIMLSSVNAARNRLMALGQVEARGDRRPSGRGGMAKVWQIAAGA